MRPPFPAPACPLRRALLASSLLSSLALAAAAPSGGADSVPAAPRPPGLLFSLTASQGTTADLAAPGTAEPTFASDVTVLPDGARGPGLQCGDLQRLAWRAPGNIRAQRGTLSFFWRSRYPVGPTEFPVFRVGFGDHSSWDMTWLRIDYNGHGFDAFVTDASLSRVRVSTRLPQFPQPTQWTHLAFAWDETRGVSLYVNGALAASNDTPAVLDTALDQFGPHSRIISPHQVQSDYNFTRGGDIDELRIHDRMLDAAAVAALARGEELVLAPFPARSLDDDSTRQEWWLRLGFNRTDDPPPALPEGDTVAVRKVEIHEAHDLQRWWWKAMDGIRETTWPGVYNRSRLPGRNDYFQLPDWDCYVDSGKALSFVLPDEEWNQLEFSGAAWGRLERLPAGTPPDKADQAVAEALLLERPRGQERTSHRLPMRRGGTLRFTNTEQEQPLGEISALRVAAGQAPAGSAQLSFRLGAGAVPESLYPLAEYIGGRYAADEGALLVAVPLSASLPRPSTSSPSSPVPGNAVSEFPLQASPSAAPAARPATAVVPSAAPAGGLPLVHLLVPDTWDGLSDGLDGLVLELPALHCRPTHGELLPLRLEVRDPLWPARALLDVSFSVRPGQARRLWLDLRDRLLPANKGLWLSLACASGEFRPQHLEGATLRLVFKPRVEAQVEHEIDRFTQVRDVYAMLVEERPRSPQLRLLNRFQGDLEDLLRVNPRHPLGLLYAAAGLNAPRPPYVQTPVPREIPAWAHRQVELLGRIETFINWYIDRRQSPYGDFGGGISDDVDLTNLWPGVALLGSQPGKVRRSVRALLEAAYRNGMFTNGLPTIQSDELHSYEEGINCLAQNLLLEPGNPVLLERAMETARGIESLTGVNVAGHRHIRSSYYSGTRIALEAPWGTSRPYSELVCQVPQLLVEFNGNPRARNYLLELTDGLLAHRKGARPTGAAAPSRRGAGEGGSLPSAIRFVDDAEVPATRGFSPWHMFWGAYKWTGDGRYLAPIVDGGVTSMMNVNANALDILGLRAEWGPRFASGERAIPQERRIADGRGNSALANFRNTAPGHFAWQLGGDKRVLEELYASQIETCASLEYINTEGSLWTDRVSVPTAELQRARLGGVALGRNALFPGHTVSWRFDAPATARSVALLLPDATPGAFKVIAYNLETVPVGVEMTGANVDPGVWEIVQGPDLNNDDLPETSVRSETRFERSRSLHFVLPPRTTTVLQLKLRQPGVAYWARPDLGLAREDLSRDGTALRVRVHSLGSVPTPASIVVLRSAAGAVLASAPIPALEAPVDLQPRVIELSLPLPAELDLRGARVEIDPDERIEEITRSNNEVSW